MLYEGERFEWAEAGTSSLLANVADVNDIMFGITVDRSAFRKRVPSCRRSTAGSCETHSAGQQPFV
jgi:hypothetical protein